MARTSKASKPMDDSELLVNSRLSSSLTQLLVGMGASLEPEREKDELTLKAEKSFAEFFKQAWAVMEPGVPYVHGWHIDAICEHLEAVSRGEIHKLLINMPPRHSKSTLVSVAFPCWEWIHRPWMKYLYSSYSGTLSIRDSVACRRLIMSPWYQANWGNVFSLTDDQNVKMRFENSRHGVRIATSVGGTTTGEGGDRIVCFPYEAKVLTEHGPMQIGDIVEQRRDLRVWCLDDDGEPCLREIERWNKNPGRPLVRVHMYEGGSVVCTGDHRIRTKAGWKEAAWLSSADSLPAFSVADICNRGLVNAKASGEGAVRLRGLEYDTDRLSCQLATCYHFPGGAVGILPDNRIVNTRVPVADSRDVRGGGVELGGEALCGVVRRADGGNIPRRKSSVRRILACLQALGSDGIGYIFGTSAVGKVFDAIVRRVAVKMSHVLPLVLRAKEGLGHELMYETVERTSVFPQTYADVTLVWRGFENFARNRKRQAVSKNDSRQAFDMAGSRNLIQSLKTGNVHPSIVQFNVGHSDSTYCLTVREHHNFMVEYVNGYYINVANCDDPHNVKEAESETVRQSVLDWWHQAMSTRLNDPKRGAHIVVMQRVHDQDLSGSILERGGYEHLCLPCRYEGQKTHWRIGWQDPRTVEGELLWPERFDEKHVSELEATLGSYAAAAQLQQRPTPAEGGIFKRQWFRTYDNRPSFIRIIESWDTATSEKELSAYSVCSVWGETVDGGIYLLHVERQRLTFPQLKAQVVNQHNRFGGTGILVEDKSSGRQLCQDLGMGTRLPLIPVQVGKGQDKVARAMGCSAMIEAGRVFIPASAPWLGVFMQEVLTFPNCQYKDQVDSMTQALNYLKGGTVVAAMDLS